MVGMASSGDPEPCFRAVLSLEPAKRNPGGRHLQSIIGATGPPSEQASWYSDLHNIPLESLPGATVPTVALN